MKKLYLILLVAGFMTSHLAAADKQPRRSLRTQKAMVAAAEDLMCTICQREIDLLGLRRHTSLRCSHMFHTTCLSQWESQSVTCPTCRTPFAEEQAQGNAIEDFGINLGQMDVFQLMDGFFLNTARSDRDFLVAMRPIFSEDIAVLAENIVDAHAVFLLVQGGRPNDALRVARFTELQGLVDFAIANGATPETSLEGPAVVLEIRLGNHSFARSWNFSEA